VSKCLLYAVIGMIMALPVAAGAMSSIVACPAFIGFGQHPDPLVSGAPNWPGMGPYSESYSFRTREHGAPATVPELTGPASDDYLLMQCRYRSGQVLAFAVPPAYRRCPPRVQRIDWTGQLWMRRQDCIDPDPDLPRTVTQLYARPVLDNRITLDGFRLGAERAMIERQIDAAGWEREITTTDPPSSTVIVTRSDYRTLLGFNPRDQRLQEILLLFPNRSRDLLLYASLAFGNRKYDLHREHRLIGAPQPDHVGWRSVPATRIRLEYHSLNVISEQCLRLVDLTTPAADLLYPCGWSHR